MEKEKIENQIPEIEDETLDQATGGRGIYPNPYSTIQYCSKCRKNKLYSSVEQETGICSDCRFGPSVRDRGEDRD